MPSITFDPKISKAVRDGDCELLEKLIAANPKSIGARTPFAGGTWLHYAASAGTLQVVERLVKVGFDVNKPGYQEGDLALDCAASAGRVDIARYLLDQGSRMDTSKSVRNPLFAAVVGKSPEIVRLLLERGIDATVRYTSDTMKGMDATAFALQRGEAEIARIITLHNAGGDARKADALLAEAQAIAEAHGSLKQMRIVPTEEDLAEEEGG